MDELQKQEVAPATTAANGTATTPKDVAMVDPRSGKPRGLEEIEREDLIIPRIAIAQAMSKRCVDGEIKVGQLYNTVTGEVFIENNQPHIEFIPIIINKSRRYFDKADKNNTICMSNNGREATTGEKCATECPYNAFDWGKGEKNEKVAPLCTSFFNYLSLIAPYQSSFPLSISMGRTSAKTGKAFNSILAMSGQDIFASTYFLTTEKKENNKGTFYVFKVRPGKRLTIEMYHWAESVAASFSTADFVIHEEGAREEGDDSDKIPF